MSGQKVINWVLFVLLSLIWGSSFILMKKGTEHLTGWQIGSLRILSAGLVFLPFAIYFITKIPLRKLPLVLLSGMLGNLFPAFLFALAIEKEENSSLAGILNSLTPLFVVVIAIVFFKVRLPYKKVAGVLVGFAGLVILSLSKGETTLEGQGFLLLILVATFFYGLNVNLITQYLRGINAVHLTAVSLALVGIPAAIVAWSQNVFVIVQNDPSAQFSVLAVVTLGVVGTGVATALYYLLIKRAGGLFASLVTYAIPFVSILWGFLDHEAVALAEIGGLAVILAGVYLANK